MHLTHAPHWGRLHDGEITLPELLSEAGYETRLAGLQHVAPERPAVVEDLSERVRTWMAEVDDSLLRGRVRYPYHQRATQDLLGAE